MKEGELEEELEEEAIEFEETIRSQKEIRMEEIRMEDLWLEDFGDEGGEFENIIEWRRVAGDGQFAVPNSWPNHQAR